MRCFSRRWGWVMRPYDGLYYLDPNVYPLYFPQREFSEAACRGLKASPTFTFPEALEYLQELVSQCKNFSEADLIICLTKYSS